MRFIHTFTRRFVRFLILVWCFREGTEIQRSEQYLGLRSGDHYLTHSKKWNNKTRVELPTIKCVRYRNTHDSEDRPSIVNVCDDHRLLSTDPGCGLILIFPRTGIRIVSCAWMCGLVFSLHWSRKCLLGLFPSIMCGLIAMTLYILSLCDAASNLFRIYINYFRHLLSYKLCSKCVWCSTFVLEPRFNGNSLFCAVQ